MKKRSNSLLHATFGKSAQQEIAGFVFIVVLVLVAIMVFISIALRQDAPEVQSKTADYLLSAIMDETTMCVVSQPEQDSVRDLIKHCYENEKCSNLDIMACTYLNQTLDGMLPQIIISDPEIKAYEMRITWEGDENSGNQGYVRILRGQCNSSAYTITGASEQVRVGGGNMIVDLKLCSDI